MDLGLALFEFLAQLVHVAQETDILLNEESFAIRILFLQILDEIIATIDAPEAVLALT